MTKEIQKFSITLTVRVNDLNYGNHVAHQNYFSYFQEARVAYLRKFGFSELNICGFGMIVSSAECKYKRELLAGDTINVSCSVTSVRSKMFSMSYQIVRNRVLCARGSTINHIYDYQKKRIVPVPVEFMKAVDTFENSNRKIGV